jgi:hypothetical protein
MIYEIIGLSATLFVLLSFLMKKIESVRIINIIGATLFVIYGLLIHSLSTWLLNGVLIIVHIIYLIKHKKSCMKIQPAKKN